MTERGFHSPAKLAFHSRTEPSSPEDARRVPLTFHSTRHTCDKQVKDKPKKRRIGAWVNSETDRKTGRHKWTHFCSVVVEGGQEPYFSFLLVGLNRDLPQLHCLILRGCSDEMIRPAHSLRSQTSTNRELARTHRPIFGAQATSCMAAVCARPLASPPTSTRDSTDTHFRPVSLYSHILRAKKVRRSRKHNNTASTHGLCEATHRTHGDSYPHCGVVASHCYHGLGIER